MKAEMFHTLQETQTLQGWNQRKQQGLWKLTDPSFCQSSTQTQSNEQTWVQAAE